MDINETVVKVISVVCRTVETIAICIIVYFLGYKAIDLLENDAAKVTMPAQMQSAVTPLGK